jgi:DNA-binding response OmpR family regulator
MHEASEVTTHASLEAGHGAGAKAAARATVLVYSSHPATLDRIADALGEQPAPGVSIDVVAISNGREAIARFDQGGIDLAILDGEAAPTGGMGMARQIKDEIDNPPPVLLIVARRDDAWLATWSRAEAVVSHPIDAVELAAAVTGLLSGVTVS